MQKKKIIINFFLIIFTIILLIIFFDFMEIFFKFNKNLINLKNLSINPSYKIKIIITQFFFTTLLFIIPSIILHNVIFKNKEREKKKYKIIKTILITVLSIIINIIIIKINSSISIPKYLKNIGELIQRKESELEILTTFITEIESYKNFILIWIIITIIPPIGEEFFFRYGLQNIFYKVLKNINISIFISAFIFSIIHCQLYGFLPRLFLGILFGYIYIWTNNIIFPIISHLINNTISLLIIIYFRKKITLIKIENYTNIYKIIFIIFIISIMYYTYRNYKKMKLKL